MEETRKDRLAEVTRIGDHVELSLTELLQRADEEIGRVTDEKESDVEGADGGLARAENRHAELLARRERRRQELEQQRSLSLQAVDRIASVLILRHTERESPDVRRMRRNLETEAVACGSQWSMKRQMAVRSMMFTKKTSAMTSQVLT